MLAQSLVEYGALASIGAGLQHAASAAGTWLETISPTMWAVAGAIVLLALILRQRRASRL